MRHILLLIHLSLDGFVSGPNGELGYFTPSDENLSFVNKITEGADAALFGRNSYQLLNDYWPVKCNDPSATKAEIAYANWYNAAQKIVVSTTLQKNEADDITLISGHTETELQKIKKLPGKNILIFGAPTLSQYLLKQHLIDEFWIFVHPYFFGKGLPLFSDLTATLYLTLLETHPLGTGEVVLHYQRKVI